MFHKSLDSSSFVSMLYWKLTRCTTQRDNTLRSLFGGCSIFFNHLSLLSVVLTTLLSCADLGSKGIVLTVAGSVHKARYYRLDRLILLFSLCYRRVSSLLTVDRACLTVSLSVSRECLKYFDLIIATWVTWCSIESLIAQAKHTHVYTLTRLCMLSV